MDEYKDKIPFNEIENRNPFRLLSDLYLRLKYPQNYREKLYRTIAMSMIRKNSDNIELKKQLKQKDEEIEYLKKKLEITKKFIEDLVELNDL